MEKNQGGKWIVFAFDRTNNTPVTGDAANITANVRIDGGAANAVDDTNPTELEDGFYVFDITAAESNGDLLVICPASSTADVQVIGVPGAIYTVPANFNATVISAGGVVNSAVQSIASAAITAASIASSAITDAKIATGAFTAAKFATDAITAAKLATDAVTEIATGVWAAATRTLTAATNLPSAADIADAVLDEALSGHATAGTLGKAVADIEADATAILADTNELQTNQGNWVTATGFATASALTTVEGKIDTIDTVVDGIQTDLSNGTDGLGAIKTAVDAIPTSNPSAASIADAVWTEAIADHSATVGSTAEALENAGAAGTPPTAAAIADAVWDEALAGHLSAGSTGASLNAAGSAGDPWTTTLPGSYTGSQAGKILADVLVDTAEIGAAGAGLTAVPWNAAWDAEVQSEVTDALNAYDPPTRAELTTDIGTVTTAISGLNDLDAAGVRAAVGLAAANLDTQLGTIDTNVDAVLVDTGTTLPASIATLDSNVDAILVDTDTTIPGLIASLNDLDAAAIRTAVGLASANLDTQLDAIPTAVENADALLNRDMSAVSDTTARSPLNALRALRNRVDASANPATVYKEDDTTAAWTTTVTTDADANNIVESNPA